jgi:hypothetical protein
MNHDCVLYKLQKVNHKERLSQYEFKVFSQRGVDGFDRVARNTFLVPRKLLIDRMSETSLAQCSRQASFRDSRNGDDGHIFLSDSSRVSAMADKPVANGVTRRTLAVGAPNA